MEERLSGNRDDENENCERKLSDDQKVRRKMRVNKK